MMIVRKPYCTDRMCLADDCSNCRGPGAYDDDTGDEVEVHDEPPDEPEPWEVGGPPDDDEPWEKHPWP